jgi:hypothetical protein
MAPLPGVKITSLLFSAWIGNVYRLVSGNTATGLLPHILVNEKSYLKRKKNIQRVTA